MIPFSSLYEQYFLLVSVLIYDPPFLLYRLRVFGSWFSVVCDLRFLHQRTPPESDNINVVFFY